MDFDIGNIFYVVITLVAVIVGILGKKKKPSGTGSGENAPKSGFLENLEKVFTMGQEDQLVVDLQDDEMDIPVEESEYEPAVSDKVSREAPRLMNEYERYMERSEKADHDIILSERDMVADSLQIIDLEDDHGTDYFEVVKDFDARTAIVYSAIINRIEY